MQINTGTEDSDQQGHEPDHTRDDTDGAQPHLPKDVIFGLLSTKRRRYVLQYLADNGDHTTLSDLSEHIAARENDTEVDLITSQQRKRVYVGLYQCHLPKLDDADVIKFNRSRGIVKRRPNADLLYPHLALNPKEAIENNSGQSGGNTTLREQLSSYLR